MESIIRQTYNIEGMNCATCAQSVENRLSGIDGVQTAHVNFAGGSVWLEYDNLKVQLQEMKASVDQIGYHLIIDQEDVSPEMQEAKEISNLGKSRTRALWSLFFSCV